MKMKGACGVGEIEFALHQSSLSRTDHSTHLPSRRRALDAGPLSRPDLRISFPHSPGRSAGPLLVSSPRPRIFQPQVLGGASGALIIEGIERAQPELAGITRARLGDSRSGSRESQRAPASWKRSAAPIVLKDNEGDILNTGTDGGKPAKDLSINFVPGRLSRTTLRGSLR